MGQVSLQVKKEIMAKAKKADQKKETKKIIFHSAPPNTIYFMGIEIEMDAREANEYVKLEYAVEAKSEKK